MNLKSFNFRPVLCRADAAIQEHDILDRRSIPLRVAFSRGRYVAPHLASGVLVCVLEDWCPPIAGFFFYYPNRRRQQPAPLSALSDTLRLSRDRRK
jgi:DNA-binding transcriptional LysR family regulator